MINGLFLLVRDAPEADRAVVEQTECGRLEVGERRGGRGLQPRFHLRPFVYGLQGGRDPETLRMVYEADPSVRLPIFLLLMILDH